MIPQEIYESTPEAYRSSGWPKRAQLGTWSSPWSGPDVKPGEGNGVGTFAHHNPDAFETGWGPAEMGITTLPVRR